MKKANPATLFQRGSSIPFNPRMAGVTDIALNEKAGVISEVFSGCVDYYPFGMQMPGRHWTADSSDEYRFGFNGKEKDNEWKGEGNSYNFGARIYDPRLGRNLTQDKYQPLAYPMVTPYSGHNNNPIANVDREGELVLFFGGYWPGRKEGEPALNYWTDELLNKGSMHFNDPVVMGFNGSGSFDSKASNRRTKGYLRGMLMANYIHQTLMKQRKHGKDNVKINFVTHSMGGAYAQGFLKALKQAKGKEGNALFSDEDFGEGIFLAPYQADDISIEQLPVEAEQYNNQSDLITGDKVEGVDIQRIGGIHLGGILGHQLKTFETLLQDKPLNDWNYFKLGNPFEIKGKENSGQEKNCDCNEERLSHDEVIKRL